MEKKSFSITFGALLLFSSLAGATEIVLPAAQIEQGKGSLSVYYTQDSKNLNLQVSSLDQIQVGGHSYFSQVSNDLETKAKDSAVTAQFTINPWSGFYYWLRAGTGNYELEIPSSTVTNRLESVSNGWRVGMGIRKLLFPDTIASAALSFEASLMYGWYPLESFRSGGSVAVPVNDSLEITELQAAVLTSKRYSKVEPYGGLKVFRDYVTLKDKANLGQISGTKDNVSVFAGAKLYVFPREALIIEGSVLGETSITIAWNVAF